MAVKLPTITDFDNIPEAALVPVDEQPYEIPAHWKWVRLGSVAEINPPKPKVSSLSLDMEVSFIPMSRVSGISGQVHDCEIRELHQVAKKYTAFASGDVLFAKITPCMENGKAAVVRELVNEMGYGSTEFFVLRPAKVLNTEFLHAFIRRESFRASAKEAMVGAVGHQRVPRFFLEQVSFPLPPLDEQQRIVEYIQKTNLKIDCAIQCLEQALESQSRLLENTTVAALRGAGVKPLPFENAPEVAESALVPVDEQPYEIPAHWKWVRLGSLVQVIRGVTYKKSEIVDRAHSNAVLIVRGGNIVDGMVCENQGDIYIPSTLVSDNKILRKSDLVIVASSGSKLAVGKAGVFERISFPSAAGGFTFLVRGGRNLIPEFLHLYFLSGEYKKRIEILALGSSINNVKMSHICDAPFPLPPLDEQQRIVEYIEQIRSIIEENRERIYKVTAELTRMRQGVIAKALSGGGMMPSEGFLDSNSAFRFSGGE